MGIFGNKKQKPVAPLASAELPEVPVHSDFPETPDELPEFPGRNKYTYQPDIPESNPEVPSTPEVDVATEMDDMIESEAAEIRNTPSRTPRKPDVLPSGLEYTEEPINEEVQKVEEDEFEVEQDMIDSLKQTRGLDFSKPLFVLVDNYRVVLEELTETKNTLKNSEDILFRINELKNEMDKKYSLWKNEMEDVQRKLVFVDKTLFEGGIRG